LELVTIPEWLPNVLYMTGSVCFFLGTLLNMVR